MLLPMVLAMGLAWPAWSNEDDIRAARAIINAQVDFRLEPEVGLLDESQERSLARRLANDVIAAYDERPERLITIRLIGSNLAYATFNHNRRRHYREDGGWTENQTRLKHERSMNRVLKEIIVHTRLQRSDARLAVFGLPVEAGELTAWEVAEVNSHYAGTISQMSAIVSDVQIDEPLSREFNVFVNATFEAHDRRGNRPIFFRNGELWRIAYARPVDKNDHYKGRGFGYFDPYNEHNRGGYNRGLENGEEQDIDLVSEVEDVKGTPLIFWGGNGAFAEQVDLSDAPLIRDRVIVFYEHEFGRYPRFNGSEWINNGLPQLADLEEHIVDIVADVNELIPDPTWDGFAVIDYESWDLVWERTPNKYRFHSKQLVRDRFPNLPEDEVERLAIEEYEAAARRFMELTIRACQSMRPSARWGYWGLGRHWQEQYPQYDWIWLISDAFYPSLYPIYYSVPDDTDEEDMGVDQRHAWHYRQRVLMYKRFIELFKRNRPVLAFGWRNYAGGPWNTYYWTAINDLDLEMMMNEWWTNDYDALVLWDRIHTEEELQSFNQFYRARMAPVVRALRGE
ncbi:MAG: hypothetical protein ACR2GY_04275 [Phycisphaerales bacterium]